MLSIIVAVAKNQVIGKDNQLIWHLPADLRYFKNLTTGHSIVMGRKTYQSIGRPLPNRRSIILSNDSNFVAEGCEVFSLAGFQTALDNQTLGETIFVIGGAEIYQLLLPMVDKIYLTEVDGEFDGDTFFPILPTDQWAEISRISHKADEKNHYDYHFVELKRIL
jgi:dihydrofolate reductase